MNGFLQDGNAALKIAPLDDEYILSRFDKLEPHLNWLYAELKDFNNFESISFNDVRFRVDRFLVIMDNIVTLLQRKSEKDIKAMMIIELELAIFSIFIIVFELLFIVNPIINRIVNQKKKLTEIAWHQSHVFNSHMKNINDLQYVLKAEKNPERQGEIFGFITEELDQLKTVSYNMVRSLEKTVNEEKPHHFVIKQVENLLERYQKNPKTKPVNDDGTVHSVEL